MPSEESTASALGKVLLGLAVLAIAVAFVVSTGGVGLVAIIPLLLIGRVVMLSVGPEVDTLARKAAKSETGRAVSRSTRVASAHTTTVAERQRVKHRARRVIGQLQEQLDAGAIGEKEFALRAQSVLARANLDRAALDDELAARLNRIADEHPETRERGGSSG